MAESRVKTKYGDFRAVIYEDAELHQVHLALIAGTIVPDQSTVVRVHSHRGVYDILAEARGIQRWSVDAALARVSRERCGVVVLLEYSDDAASLDRRLRGDTTENGESGELRMIGAGSQILADLNVGKVRVLGTPKRTHALSGFGLEVVDYIDKPEAG